MADKMEHQAIEPASKHQKEAIEQADQHYHIDNAYKDLCPPQLAKQNLLTTSSIDDFLVQNNFLALPNDLKVELNKKLTEMEKIINSAKVDEILTVTKNMLKVGKYKVIPLENLDPQIVAGVALKIVAHCHFEQRTIERKAIPSAPNTPVSKGKAEELFENALDAKYKYAKHKEVRRRVGADEIHICQRCQGAKVVMCGSCNGHGQLTCSKCGGHGYLICGQCNGHKQYETRCPKCSRGELRIPEHRNGQTYWRVEQCLYCDASGRVIVDCGECDANGRVGCGGCKSTGRIVCEKCSGHGKLQCTNCKGLGAFLKYEEITIKSEPTIKEFMITPFKNHSGKVFNKHISPPGDIFYEAAVAGNRSDVDAIEKQHKKGKLLFGKFQLRVIPVFQIKYRLNGKECSIKLIDGILEEEWHLLTTQAKAFKVFIWAGVIVACFSTTYYFFSARTSQSSTSSVVVKQPELAQSNKTKSEAVPAMEVPSMPLDNAKKGDLEADASPSKEIPNILLDSAEKGDPDSQFKVAELYVSGEDASKFYSKAVYWYKKAAAQGHADAQYRLGVMYKFGSGVGKNVSEANDWFEKAAMKGNISAADELKRHKAVSNFIPPIGEKPKEKSSMAVQTNTSSAGIPQEGIQKEGQGLPPIDKSAGALIVKADTGDRVEVNGRAYDIFPVVITSNYIGRHNIFVVRKGKKKPFLTTVNVKEGETLEITPVFD